VPKTPEPISAASDNFKNQPCKLKKFQSILLIFSLKISSHITSNIAANVKDTICAISVVTVSETNTET